MGSILGPLNFRSSHIAFWEFLNLKGQPYPPWALVGLIGNPPPSFPPVVGGNLPPSFRCCGVGFGGGVDSTYSVGEDIVLRLWDVRLGISADLGDSCWGLCNID